MTLAEVADLLRVGQRYRFLTTDSEALPAGAAG
jgi:hypothetical protein